MNKRELLLKTSKLSGIETSACEKVLKTLEEVMSDELESSKNAKSFFEKLYNLMSILKK